VRRSSTVFLLLAGAVGSVHMPIRSVPEAYHVFADTATAG
jgi:hypothetical protein